MQALVTGVVEEGNPLGSGGAMEILQKGIRWGAVTGMGLEMAGEPGGSKGGGEEKLPDADGVLPQA